MAEQSLDTTAVLQQLNKILELELAGVIRYTHYSFMAVGFGRIPIVSWLRSQADVGLPGIAQDPEHPPQLGE